MTDQFNQFTYHSDPVRVVFGPGSVGALAAEADRHKMSRLIVLCSKTRGDMARQPGGADRRARAGLLRYRRAEHAARGVRAYSLPS